MDFEYNEVPGATHGPIIEASVCPNCRATHKGFSPAMSVMDAYVWRV